MARDDVMTVLLAAWLLLALLAVVVGIGVGVVTGDEAAQSDCRDSGLVCRD